MADFGESIDDSELRRQLMHYTGRESKESASMRSKFQNPRHEPPISKKPYNSNGFSSDRPRSLSTKGFSSDESDGEFSSRPPKSSRLFDGASKFSLTRPSLRSSASSKYLSTNSGHRAEGQSNGWTVHKNHKTKSSDAVKSSGTRPEPDGVSQNISLFVLAAGGLFFMTVAYVYIYWGYNAIVFNDPRDSFIICPKNANSSDVCVKKQDLRKVQNLVESIIQLARSASGDCECGYRQHSSLTRDEVERFVSSNSQDVSPDVIFEIFYVNLHWETRTYDKDRKISLSSSLINFIETDVSRMSLLCMLKKAAIYALSLFGVCSFVALFCLAVRTFWSARQKRKEIESRRMNEIMERVIDVLKQHSDLCELKPQNYQPWLPVLNIRDLIIPLGERKTLRPVWEKAIKQLRSRESRMAWKMDFVAGEECEVIRWLPLSLNKNHLNGNAKTWQGSAIGGDSPKKVINKLYPPLTSCLKVRNMFDLSVEVGDGWKTVVRDAILEKVGVDHGIVHIEVDGQSKDGCVYVRCKDENSAGQAFTNLHGWWFDGRLVTVKYLRLQRFIERFPDTMAHDAPLRPSNPARLSLSVPAHSSILENS